MAMFHTTAKSCGLIVECLIARIILDVGPSRPVLGLSKRGNTEKDKDKGKT